MVPGVGGPGDLRPIRASQRDRGQLACLVLATLHQRPCWVLFFSLLFLMFGVSKVQYVKLIDDFYIGKG